MDLLSDDDDSIKSTIMGAKHQKLWTPLAQLIYKKFVEAMPYLRNFKYLLAQKKDLPQFREIFGN